MEATACHPVHATLHTLFDPSTSETLVLADRDGLIIASAGPKDVSEEVAAHSAIMARNKARVVGRVQTDTHEWEVEIQRFEVGGSPFYLSQAGKPNSLRLRRNGVRADSIRKLQGALEAA